ncbi:MFS transporter [[Acholeplasma] multilocale]|uniref:MFS transporter n=1 Tax=[Acholeplasma] multilocale TaxID=264638 RepID=UPI000478A645|nr:MFS transporter [[Acholeplasma] multilocale]
MNIKTYTFTKYIATISSLFLLLAPLLVFLSWWKDIFKGNTNTLNTVSAILLVIGLVGIIVYLVLRMFLKTKSGYTYTKKDNWFITGSLISYGIAGLMSLIYTVIGLTTKNHEVGMNTFYGIFPLIFIGMVCGSIFESVSRIGEQIFLYNQEQDRLKEAKAQKVKELSISPDDEIDEKVLEKVVKPTKKTCDAEKLLSKDTKVRKDVVVKKTTTVKIEEEKYNPFMDEKLNQGLENDQDLKEFLNKKNSKKDKK